MQQQQQAKYPPRGRYTRDYVARMSVSDLQKALIRENAMKRGMYGQVMALQRATSEAKERQIKHLKEAVTEVTHYKKTIQTQQDEIRQLKKRVRITEEGDKMEIDEEEEDLVCFFPSMIERLYKEHKKEFSCVVCYDSLLGKDVAMGACMHFFCKGCKDSLEQPKCPVCRRHFN